MTPADEQDTQAVLAYRVGQLEKSQIEGFKSLGEKLDSITHNFVTRSDMAALEKQATAEHAAIRVKMDTIRETLENDILDVKRDVGALQKQRWIQNTLSAVLGAILAILISYFFTNIAR